MVTGLMNVNAIWSRPADRMNPTLQERNDQLAKLASSLPGSIPYDNVRPINIPGRLDGQTLISCCTSLHPHVARSKWEEWFRSGHILLRGNVVEPDFKVRGGQQFEHLFPNTTEPDVDGEVRILREEPRWIVIEKPAPLPVHPSGRFNRNSLTSLLDRVYENKLKLVHRLDANTTGVMVMARDRDTATELRGQFERNEVEKTYVARCCGLPDQDKFVIDTPISNEKSMGGGRELDSAGPPAITYFEVLERRSDQTCLLKVKPATGRTNQIRVHLWSIGHPIQGDPTYLPNHGRAAKQTLTTVAPPMCLHAWQLRLLAPGTSHPISFVSPMPHWASVTSTP